MSRKIADLFDDERYFAALGSLSDYETLTSPPRHIHKVITLCLIYGVSFADLLTVAGVKLEELGRDSIPIKAGPISDRVKGEGALERVASQGANPVLTSLMMEFGEVPFFLRGSFAAFSGIKKPSLRDLFYVGPESDPRHSHLDRKSVV